MACNTELLFSINPPWEELAIGPELPTPIHLDPVFDDPAPALACIRAGAPYRLQSVVDGGYGGYGGADHDPWFRGSWVVPGKTFLKEAAALLHAPRRLRNLEPYRL